MSDSNVLQRIRAGSEKEFEALFHEYYEALCHFALKLLSDPDEAEEIVQDTFVKFWNKKNKISISSSLKSYLFQTVKNASLNRIQHLKVVRDHAQGQLQTSKEFDASDHLVGKELNEKIRASLDQLPPERKKIFLMSRNEGLKYKEIAEKMNISIKTVENQMGKALKFMRKELSEFLSICMIMVIELIKGTGL